MWLPCEFCERKHSNSPCIKKWGPKRESGSTPSWAVGPPDDAIVKPEDRLLFQYAYSDELFQDKSSWTLLRLMRKFIAGYGGTLSSPSLRHAILALAAHKLPAAQFGEQETKHTQNAIIALRKKTVNTVDDSDLLATLILSNTARTRNEHLIHRNGMLACLNILLSTRTVVRQEIVACFRPLFVEYLFPGGIRSLDSIKGCAQSFNLVAFSVPTWDDRLRGMTEVLQNSATSPLVPRLGTTVSVLRWACWDMVNALVLAHDREEKQGTDCDACLGWMTSKWRNDLQQAECIQLLTVTEEMLKNDTVAWQDDRCLPITYYLAARLLFLLIENISILDGLRTAEAISTAWKLASFIRTTEKDVRFDKPEIRAFLFLAGLALPINDSTGT